MDHKEVVRLAKKYKWDKFFGKHKRKKNTEKCPHFIKCCFNGLWWVCPNPYDKQQIRELDEQFKKKLFTKCQGFTISDEDFNNNENWNP